MADWMPKSAEPVWMPKSAISVDGSENTTSEPSIGTKIWEGIKKGTSRLLSGPTTEDRQKIRDEVLGSMSSGEIDKAKKNNTYNTIGQIAGMPEDEKSILPKIKSEPSTYMGGFAKSLYNDFVSPLGTPSGVLGSSGPKPTGVVNPQVMEDVIPTKPRLALPPAPEVRPTRFISGPSGAGTTTELAPPQANLAPLPADVVPRIDPAIEAKTAGIGGIKDTGGSGVVSADLDQLQEQKRIGSIRGSAGWNGMTSVGQEPGPINLPSSMGDTRGGFGERTNANLSYPENVVPSNVLPRTVQSDMLRHIPTDTTAPNPFEKPSSDINFTSGGPEVTRDIQNIREPNTPSYPPESLNNPPDLPSAGEFNEKLYGNKASVDPAIKEKSAGSTVESTPIDTAKAKTDSNPAVPAPGSAVPTKPSKDISAFRAEFGSVDKTLASRPETAPIAEAIIGAADKKAGWIATTERSLADMTNGLSKSDRIKVGNLLDKYANPAEAPIEEGSVGLRTIAQKLRLALTDIHSQIPGGLGPQGQDVGFIENYLSHIKKMGGDDLATGLKQIWEYHFKKPFDKMFSGDPLAKKSSGLGDMYDQKLGNPSSQFAQTRKGLGRDIELDVNKVIPAYVESIAKLIHDRPAVDAAKKVIAGLPDKDIYGSPNKIKELSEWYVKNYTRYDSMPGLTSTWNDLSSRIMRTTSRSMLGFSTGLQTLHLARIPANLFPELPAKYLAAGIKELISNPRAAYREAANLGLLQNEVRPFAFKTPMQKVDSILSFFSATDFLDRSIGYHGFKKMLMDGGMDEAAASAKAISESKRASLLVDTARPIKSFNPEGSSGGAAWKLATQFKQVPIKIIEQYATIASNAKKDPAAAARLAAGLGLTIAASEAGLHTFHISPKQFALDTGGAFGSVVGKVGRALMAGDVETAVKETALWLTPGGISMRRQLNQGPSMFDSEQNNSLREPTMR